MGPLRYKNYGDPHALRVNGRPIDWRDSQEAAPRFPHTPGEER